MLSSYDSIINNFSDKELPHPYVGPGVRFVLKIEIIEGKTGDGPGVLGVGVDG